ncbi:hypothetical protein N7540_004694 [Penicillium herquei]|nr:hypothetical protein N7540_004694 [Penicillium herquei]
MKLPTGPQHKYKLRFLADRDKPGGYLNGRFLHMEFTLSIDLQAHEKDALRCYFLLESTERFSVHPIHPMSPSMINEILGIAPSREVQKYVNAPPDHVIPKDIEWNA